MLTQTETQLIKELKTGSIKAFDAIYKLYASRLYSFCYSYTKSKEVSEDIVQDVFMKLWNMREEIRQEDTLKSLLFIMVKHKANNAVVATVNSPKFEDYVEYCNSIPDGERHDQMEYDEFLNQVKHVIAELPTTQRKVVELSKFELFSNKEIAGKLGLSEQTVKNNLTLGMKLVRKRVGQMITVVLLFINNAVN